MKNRNCAYCLMPNGHVCGIGYCHRHDGGPKDSEMLSFNGIPVRRWKWVDPTTIVVMNREGEAISVIQNVRPD